MLGHISMFRLRRLVKQWKDSGKADSLEFCPNQSSLRGLSCPSVSGKSCRLLPSRCSLSSLAHSPSSRGRNSRRLSHKASHRRLGMSHTEGVKLVIKLPLALSVWHLSLPTLSGNFVSLLLLHSKRSKRLRFPMLIGRDSKRFELMSSVSKLVKFPNLCGKLVSRFRSKFKLRSLVSLHTLSGKQSSWLEAKLRLVKLRKLVSPNSGGSLFRSCPTIRTACSGFPKRCSNLGTSSWKSPSFCQQIFSSPLATAKRNASFHTSSPCTSAARSSPLFRARCSRWNSSLRSWMSRRRSTPASRLFSSRMLFSSNRPAVRSAGGLAKGNVPVGVSHVVSPVLVCR
mmetsp:Transcript_45537/g.91928  ORF Transcript_45537/g.91928 Transcript_45537/m.91928 type:complete len:341 (+) Transcript_45537:1309-2331(+)